MSADAIVNRSIKSNLSKDDRPDWGGTILHISIVALAVLPALSGFGLAQEQYSAYGTVTNGVTGKPEQAVVSIIRASTPSEAANVAISGAPLDAYVQQALSGPGGEFRFKGLIAGPYLFDVEKAGFTPYSQSFTLSVASPDAVFHVSLMPATKPPAPPVYKISGKVQGDLAPGVVSFEISGRIKSDLPPGSVIFELVRGTGPDNPIRSEFDVATGEFAVPDVPPGEYRLLAKQDNRRGEARVSVQNADVSGVWIDMVLAPTIQGVMRSVGGRADVIRLLDPCNISLRQRGHPDVVYVPAWKGDGQFSLEDVLPGDYNAELSCFGAYFKSALFGGADLLRNPALTVSPGLAAPPIEIAFTPGGGALLVRFKDPVQALKAVLLVPSFPESTGPQLQRVHDFLLPLDQDMLQFSNLTPGDYTIYTLPRFEGVDFQSPGFLDALSGGTSVHVEDGETAERTITADSK